MEQVVWVAESGDISGDAIVGIYSTFEIAVEAITAYAKAHDDIEIEEPDEQTEDSAYWELGDFWYQVAKFTVNEDWRQK